MKLTDQQQAIVNHLRGPALVFAVAGSGKTTCMVHRIKHLIDKRIFTPRQILATSFNNSAVQDITSQLARLGVSGGVECRTLHSLGYKMIRSAVERGYVDKSWLQSKDPEKLHARLIDETLIQLAKAQDSDTSNLNIDREDLQNQISTWKANLVYASLENAGLPEAGRQFARQAVHAHEQYVLAYQIYEDLRTQRNILTFDDMLMMGWEMLLRFPDILETVQSAYQGVMVDEFQDVNYAQYLMVDWITRRHRNYMAIGDDDQCIYEWRGANPRFILEFEKNYGATVYTISDNFRSTAQQIVLANKIIAVNQTRYPKQLSLTKGFDGKTIIHEETDHFRAAVNLVKEIERLVNGGKLAPPELVILVRLYSQTAFLETALMDAQIPYEVIGNEVFYRRNELIPLFQYLSFARAEQEIAKRGFPNDSQKVDKYLEMFRNILNKPRRYVAKDNVDSIAQSCRRRKRSALAILAETRDQFKRGTQKKVDEFIDTINRLIPRLGRPAHKTLLWLVEKIAYRDYLLEISGMLEIGMTRVQNVQALIEFARIKDLKCPDFVEYIRKISLEPIPNPHNLPPVKIMSIHRAKGLEWDTVFVPGCNEELIPCIAAETVLEPPALAQLMEAERRLFYVAVTRAKKTLHLYYSKEKALSPFLAEIAAGKLLEEVEQFAAVLRDQKPIYREKTFIEFCRRVAGFHLERYFTRWFTLPRYLKDNLAALLIGLDKKLAQAKAEEAAYQAAMREYQQKKRQYQQQNAAWEKGIRQGVILIRKYKSALQPVHPRQMLHFELFEDGDVMALSDQGFVGVVEFNRMPEFDRQAVIWEHSTARVENITGAGSLIESRFAEVLIDEARRPYPTLYLEPPKPPTGKYKAFLDPDFIKGMEILKQGIG